MGGYGDVLERMAGAKRYEEGDAPNAVLLSDMKERFHLLNPEDDDRATMEALGGSDSDDVDVDGDLRRCSGLVLKAMGF